MKIKLLIPVYNDWESLLRLLQEIDENIGVIKKTSFSVFIINDGSDNKDFFRLRVQALELKNIKLVEIMHLKENQGHAKAITNGLGFIYARLSHKPMNEEKYDYVIPMDGDGEDRPEELFLFCKEIKLNPDRIILGKRVKRSEGIIFRICYSLHKFLTAIYLGRYINFGNYVCLPKYMVKNMVKNGFSQNSFSGTLFQELDGSPYPPIEIPSVRGERYHGPSKMSFLNLLKHSIMIFSVNYTKVRDRVVMSNIALLFSSGAFYVQSQMFSLSLFLFILVILNSSFYLIVKFFLNKIITEIKNKEPVAPENIDTVEKIIL